MRILIVNHDRFLCSAILRLLRGFEVVVASTASGALAKLARTPHDVVVVDDGGRSYDFHQLLTDVAAAHSDVRRVLMTNLLPAFANDHIVSRRVHGVLTKPFNRSDLLHAIGPLSVGPRLQWAG